MAVTRSRTLSWIQMMARLEQAGPGHRMARLQQAGPGHRMARLEQAGPGQVMARLEQAGPGQVMARLVQAGPGYRMARLGQVMARLEQGCQTGPGQVRSVQVLSVQVQQVDTLEY